VTTSAKTAIVTGASRGIGMQIAIALGRAGRHEEDVNSRRRSIDAR
jgi:NAD(P)-dependent dehydrogenase (short-subunit alcohol dehydrogenase family)